MNTVLPSIIGFDSFIGDDTFIRIENNAELDCLDPEPNFAPVDSSFGNLVDCPI